MKMLQAISIISFLIFSCSEIKMDCENVWNGHWWFIKDNLYNEILVESDKSELYMEDFYFIYDTEFIIRKESNDCLLRVVKNDADYIKFKYELGNDEDVLITDLSNSIKINLQRIEDSETIANKIEGIRIDSFNNRMFRYKYGLKN